MKSKFVVSWKWIDIQNASEYSSVFDTLEDANKYREQLISDENKWLKLTANLQVVIDEFVWKKQISYDLV